MVITKIPWVAAVVLFVVGICFGFSFASCWNWTGDCCHKFYVVLLVIVCCFGMLSDMFMFVLS